MAGKGAKIAKGNHGLRQHGWRVGATLSTLIADMSPDLENRIANWKKETSDKKEHRSASVKAHPIHKDEYDILLKIELRVTNGVQTEKVTVKNRMMTQNGGSSKDLAMLEEAIRKLEDDFRFRGGQAFIRMEQMSRPGEDVERNPYN